jgi:hypothetical protein
VGGPGPDSPGVVRSHLWLVRKEHRLPARSVTRPSSQANTRALGRSQNTAPMITHHLITMWCPRLCGHQQRQRASGGAVTCAFGPALIAYGPVGLDGCGPYGPLGVPSGPFTCQLTARHTLPSAWFTDMGWFFAYVGVSAVVTVLIVAGATAVFIGQGRRQRQRHRGAQEARRQEVLAWIAGQRRHTRGRHSR